MYFYVLCNYVNVVKNFDLYDNKMVLEYKWVDR